jgi:hypothetical protein
MYQSRGGRKAAPFFCRVRRRGAPLIFRPAKAMPGGLVTQGLVPSVVMHCREDGKSGQAEPFVEINV